MYKIASDTAQRQARQLWMRDLIGDQWETLPPEQLRDNLVRKWKQLTALLTDGKLTAKQRYVLGAEVQRVQEEIRAIRPRLKGPPSVAQCFVDVAREELPKVTFDRYMDAASKRAREAATP